MSCSDVWSHVSAKKTLFPNMRDDSHSKKMSAWRGSMQAETRHTKPLPKYDPKVPKRDPTSLVFGS